MNNVRDYVEKIKIKNVISGMDNCYPNNPCQNNGVCKNEWALDSYSCSCAHGFIGDNCTISTNVVI